MTTLYESAYAKINLTLDILCKREDGFHDLETIMQTLSLCDDVEIDVQTGKEWTLWCDKEDVPCDSRNLAWKAAELFEQHSGRNLGGVAIRIKKRIPSQAGMGGGSSDAAAVLRMLNRYCGHLFSEMELADLGGRIGSDVPFCVAGGTCMCEGRGERLRRLPAMPECTILVCKPEFGVSTPALYRTIDEKEILRRPDNAAMEQALKAKDLASIARGVWNVFDPVVSEVHPEMNEIRDVMQQCGALGQQMTGSGSAFFGVMPDAQSAERAAEQLRRRYSCIFICKPV